MEIQQTDQTEMEAQQIEGEDEKEKEAVEKKDENKEVEKKDENKEVEKIDVEEEKEKKRVEKLEKETKKTEEVEPEMMDIEEERVKETKKTEEEEEKPEMMEMDEKKDVDDKMEKETNKTEKVEEEKLEMMEMEKMEEETKSEVKETKDREGTEVLKEQPSFMFSISDGKFTMLSLLWANEEKAALGHETQFWHRRHDYWLLAGIVTHGYGRWQDIQNDVRFAIINEPFKKDVGKGNFHKIKNSFLEKRFKLLEKALVIEEQLRSSSLHNVQQDNKPTITDINKEFLKPVELLSDMNSGETQLPASLAQIPPVVQQIQMAQQSIHTRLGLTSAAGNMNRNKQVTDCDWTPLSSLIDDRITNLAPQYSIPHFNTQEKAEAVGSTVKDTGSDVTTVPLLLNI
ncbi:hypothetical protein Pmani_016852 [Petrolisthes manimaculis]|uniref:CHD C-terminal 2 domain-containing protein n=1 Tax=Petrolisthes manimaculis TaxID=1843537 RepID=A0AAE1PNU3_9EUCA|nr:hypothetical protein Pmani_016852 [Petrolisthes manimaculis]